MKRRRLLVWIALAAITAGGLVILGKPMLSRWLEHRYFWRDPQGTVRDNLMDLVPVFTNLYSTEGLAPTGDEVRNKSIFVSHVTDRLDCADEPPPPGYSFWDDARCYLFLPSKLESNSVSILLLMGGGKNAVPDAWAAVTYYRGNFEVISISRYSQRWLDTVMSRKPDFYFWRLRGGYLRHQAEERASAMKP